MSERTRASRIARNHSFTYRDMKSVFFAAAAISWGLLSVLIGGESVQAAQNGDLGKPKIKFDKSVYDFGTVSDVDRVTGTFIVENVGDGVLRIGKPSTSCGCTVAGVKPDVLQPGEKGELAFTLSLGRSRAIFQKTITVSSNDPETPKSILTVKADYTPLYITRPLSFYLNLRKGQTTNLTTHVTRTDGKELKIISVKPTQPWITATVEPDPNSTNRSARIKATLAVEGSPGYFTEYVNVFVDGSDQPAFSVTMTGRIYGDLTWTPENVYWPVTDAARAMTTKKVILRSSLPQKLEVKNISTTLNDMTLEAVPRPDGKSMELVAKLSSVPAKSVNGTIRFETNIPSQPVVEVPVWINVIPRPVPQKK